MKTNPNDSVFSIPAIYDATTRGRGTTDGIVRDAEEGITKREYFAVMAMQGMLARSPRDLHEMSTAVQFANALIKELNKNENE
jgi:hypothetical protein